MLLKRRRSAKNRRDKVVALEMNPNKTIGGDLRGRRANLRGSETEVSDLEKNKVETLKIQTSEIAKTLPQKLEGTRALRGKIPS